MKNIFFLVAANANFAAIAGKNLSVHTILTNVDSTPAYEMKQYWLVLLYSGTQRSQGSITTAKIQQAYINNIERLSAEQKIIRQNRCVTKHPWWTAKGKYEFK